MKPSAITSLIVSLLLGASNVHAELDRTRPDIILIMVDDMGNECVTANGRESYSTPNLDCLARGGMRFEQCYSQPICTLSRVRLMTGIYNQRNCVRFGILGREVTTFGYSD